MRTMSCGMRHTNRWRWWKQKNQRQCRARTNSGPAVCRLAGKEYGQRPIIFYTNGYDIWLWDDHKTHGYPPRRVFGFYSKESLQYLIQQRETRLPLNSVPYVKITKVRPLPDVCTSLKPLPVSASGLPTNTGNR